MLNELTTPRRVRTNSVPAQPGHSIECYPRGLCRNLWRLLAQGLIADAKERAWVRIVLSHLNDINVSGKGSEPNVSQIEIEDAVKHAQLVGVTPGVH
jgi:hypothetical protein